MAVENQTIAVKQTDYMVTVPGWEQNQPPGHGEHPSMLISPVFLLNVPVGQGF